MINEWRQCSNNDKEQGNGMPILILQLCVQTVRLY